MRERRFDVLEIAGCPESRSEAREMSNKKTIFATIGLLLLQASMMGCDHHEPVPEPDVKRTQAPRERYKLTISLPEELGSAPLKRARANYSIENKTCVPMDYTMALGGTRPHFIERVDIDLRRTGDAEYTGYLYGDAFVSADHYGLGVCKWKLEDVDMLLGFRHDISLGVGGEWVLKGEGIQSKACPKNGHPDLPIWGCLDLTAIAPSKDSDYFEVSVRTDKEW